MRIGRNLDRRDFLRLSAAFATALPVLGWSGMAGAAGRVVEPYPRGRAFPLGLYSIEKSGMMNRERPSGWNIAHEYGFRPGFLNEAAKGGMYALAALPGKKKPLPRREMRKYISDVAARPSLAWWDFPEEMRYWYAGEMAIVTKYARWTRRYDPRRRPNYMYIPGHYDAEAVSRYVDHLDVIPASVYTKYMGMPQAWARWRMETTIAGITRAGGKIGPNYLEGEKTPVAVLELFWDEEEAPPTPTGIYHDLWESIVSGARGVLVYSYFHRNDHPDLAATWRAYKEAAAQLSGPERLGEVILYGEQRPEVEAAVTRGPARTPRFAPFEGADSVDYPSVHVRALSWDGSMYVIAVNSAEDAVSARISGLPPDARSAEVLFTNQTVQISDGKLDSGIEALGVRIFKID